MQVTKLSDLKFFPKGVLYPAIIQDHQSGRVLMLGYMNREALWRTIQEGVVTFWSRSRKCYWKKGETSGHFQYPKLIEVDCDRDALLIQVEQVEAACHTGEYSCFDSGGVIWRDTSAVSMDK